MYQFLGLRLLCRYCSPELAIALLKLRPIQWRQGRKRIVLRCTLGTSIERWNSMSQSLDDVNVGPPVRPAAHVAGQRSKKDTKSFGPHWMS